MPTMTMMICDGDSDDDDGDDFLRGADRNFFFEFLKFL